jgi:hypothetical protein
VEVELAHAAHAAERGDSSRLDGGAQQRASPGRRPGGAERRGGEREARGGERRRARAQGATRTPGASNPGLPSTSR